MWLVLAMALGAQEQVLAQALAAEGQGDDAKAISLLEGAVKLEPVWPLARLELGRLELKTGQTLRASFELDVARALAPENPRAHYLYALAVDELGHRDEARRSLEVALVLRPDFSDAEARLAGLLFAQGDFAGAAAAYAHFSKGHPADLGAKLQRAAALEKLNDLKGAEGLLRAVLHDVPNQPVATRRLMDLLTRQGRTAEAQKLAAPARQLRPLGPSSH